MVPIKLIRGVDMMCEVARIQQARGQPEAVMLGRCADKHLWARRCYSMAELMFGCNCACWHTTDGAICVRVDVARTQINLCIPWSQDNKEAS